MPRVLGSPVLNGFLRVLLSGYLITPPPFGKNGVKTAGLAIRVIMHRKLSGTYRLASDVSGARPLNPHHKGAARLY